MIKSQHCQNLILYGEICQIFDQRRKNDQKKKKKNVKKWLPYPYLAPYNTRKEDLHRRISVVHESRNVQHAKKVLCHFDVLPIYMADSAGLRTLPF